MADKEFMGTTSHASLTRYLPFVLIATAVITLTPALLIWGLAREGIVEGFIPLMVIGVIASMAIGYVGRIAWQRRPESKDIIFADLLLWGWVRRWRIERRLGDATALLGISNREARKEAQPARQVEALKDLATALEARDPYTHGHSRRVARYSAMIAEKLGLSDSEVRKVRTAAAVHDVGKLELPLNVLNKPGKLSDDEFALIKSHAPLGAEMVKSLGDRELTEMVAHHHERLDGTGYPSRLAGEQIPLGARIIAVADTFDALTSTRAYRGAKRHKEALAILHAEAGTQLDPLAVQAFDRCYAGSFGGLTVWALLASLPHRLWAPLESQISVAQAAGGAMTTKAITVAAATAATGTIALSPLADPRDTNTDDLTANLASSSALAGGGPAILRVVEDPLTAAAASSDAAGGPEFSGSSNARGLDPDVGALARDGRRGGYPEPAIPTTMPAIAPATPAASPVLVDNPPADNGGSEQNATGKTGGDGSTSEPGAIDTSDLPGTHGIEPADSGQGTAKPDNPGQGGGNSPSSNPGQGGGKPSNPGQGGGNGPSSNPGQGGGQPDNPGQGGGPPDNPGQGGGPPDDLPTPGQQPTTNAPSDPGPPSNPGQGHGQGKPPRP